MIKIDLNKWENAMFPINTSKVDLTTCEELLYEKLTKEYGYSDEDIQQYLEGDLNKMVHTVNYLEERILLENGGTYYD